MIEAVKKSFLILYCDYLCVMGEHRSVTVNSGANQEFQLSLHERLLWTMVDRPFKIKFGKVNSALAVFSFNRFVNYSQLIGSCLL